MVAPGFFGRKTDAAALNAAVRDGGAGVAEGPGDAGRSLKMVPHRAPQRRAPPGP